MPMMLLPLARRLLGPLSAAAALTLLAGCGTPAITNITSETVPENPSGIYTIQARVRPSISTVIPETVRVRIFIDGQAHPMRRSTLGPDFYEYDYQIPAGRTEAKYYILLNYKVSNDGIISDREEYTGITRLQLASRYAFSLDVNRAPIGARVSVLGRGFTQQDTVFVGETAAATTFESSNSLGFTVPPVEPNQNYKVSFGGPGGTSLVGTLRVDAPAGGSPALPTLAPTSTVAPVPLGGAVQVTPARINARQGEKLPVTFTLPAPAGASGQKIEVTTDIPQSVILPEATVPANATTVTLTFEAGQPGNGNLYVSTGRGEVVVPVSITKR